MTTFTRVTRIILWASALGLCLWVLDQNLMLNGRLRLECRLDDCSRRIEGFAVKGNGRTAITAENGEQILRLATDPLRLTAKLFRRVNEATVRVVYRNPDHVPHLSVNFSGRPRGTQDLTLADDVPLLDTLAKTWTVLRDGDQVLFTRPDARLRSYQRVDDFLADLPPPSRIATYNVDVSPNLKIAKYRPSPAPTELSASLRGAYTLRLYVGSGEPLAVTLKTRDVNHVSGSDQVRIKIYHGADVIQDIEIPDDGNQRGDDGISALRETSLRMDGLSDGTYRVDVVANDDIFTQSISTSGAYAMFERRIFPVGSEQYPKVTGLPPGNLTVYARGTSLSIKTVHAETLQTVMVGNQRHELPAVSRALIVPLPSRTVFTPVTLSIRDAILETDGSFVLDPAQAIPISAHLVQDLTTEKDLSNIDYVIAEYRPAQPSAGWLVAEQTIGDLPRTSDQTVIVTSVPPLDLDGATLDIREVSLTFKSSPLTPRKIVAAVWGMIRGIFS